MNQIPFMDVFKFFIHSCAHMQAISPDGQTVVTGAGDETLRFWNVFYKSKSHKVQLGCCFTFLGTAYYLHW